MIAMYLNLVANACIFIEPHILFQRAANKVSKCLKVHSNSYSFQIIFINILHNSNTYTRSLCIDILITKKLDLKFVEFGLFLKISLSLLFGRTLKTKYVRKLLRYLSTTCFYLLKLIDAYKKTNVS